MILLAVVAFASPFIAFGALSLSDRIEFRPGRGQSARPLTPRSGRSNY